MEPIFKIADQLSERTEEIGFHWNTEFPLSKAQRESPNGDLILMKSKDWTVLNQPFEPYVYEVRLTIKNMQVEQSHGRKWAGQVYSSGNVPMSPLSILQLCNQLLHSESAPLSFMGAYTITDAWEAIIDDDGQRTLTPVFRLESRVQAMEGQEQKEFIQARNNRLGLTNPF
jgi:hypothetical protein